MKKNKTKIPFCLPIIENEKDKVLKIIRKNLRKYSYFEVWLDYINDIDKAFIEKLIKLFKNKIIFILRKKGFKKTRLIFKQRAEIILFLKNSPSFLDLDINMQKKELLFIQKNALKIKIIGSYHNYKETPNDLNLKKIVNIICSYKPKILKISAMCNNYQDALRLLQLLLELKSKKLKYIILGMGKFGVITRILGTLWGNKIIFAPQLLNKKSAKGQLTKKQLENILKNNFYG